MAEPTNIAEGLAREISRVTRILVHYEEIITANRLGEFPQLSPLTESVVVPMIQSSLETAIKAAGSNDVLQVLKILATLKGIE